MNTLKKFAESSDTSLYSQLICTFDYVETDLKGRNQRAKRLSMYVGNESLSLISELVNETKLMEICISIGPDEKRRDTNSVNKRKLKHLLSKVHGQGY